MSGRNKFQQKLFFNPFHTRRFPSQDVFAEMFKEAGFEEVEYTNFMGGISCIHSGFKFDQIKKD